MRELRISPLAVADLEDIWLYSLDRWGADQADRYLRNLSRSMERLRDDPGSGRAEDALRLGYRSLHVGRHLVFYTFTDLAVIIRRVLHDQMDLPRHL